MSQVLIDAKLYVAGHNFSGQMNALALEYAAEAKDATTFGATTRINAAGLKSIVASHAGLWDATATTSVDPVLFARVGTADLPVAIAPGGAAGAVAYLFRALNASYKVDAQIGELLPFTVEMEGSGGAPLVRGSFLHDAAATGNVTGAALQLGAVATGKALYAALHVFSGTGSFVVKIQSDTVETFDDDPTDRITFATVATGVAVAAEWKSVAGPITDTWWRVVATNPNTRNFAVAAGIQ